MDYSMEDPIGKCAEKMEEPEDLVMDVKEKAHVDPEKVNPHDLTFVDEKTHLRYSIPNELILTTCYEEKALKRGHPPRTVYFLRHEVVSCIDRGIAQAKESGYESPDSRYVLNFPLQWDGTKSVPKGIAFVFFYDSGFVNIFMGNNADNSARVEYYPDPNFVPDEWDSEEEEGATPQSPTLDWSQIANVTGNWADMIFEDELDKKKKAKKECPMLSRTLKPLAILTARSGGEKYQEVVVKAGFAKLKKSIIDAHDISVLHTCVPGWVDIHEIYKIFKPYTKNPKSYPIVEVTRGGETYHLYVTYEGSAGSVSAQQMIFKVPISNGGKETTIAVAFAKKKSYENCVEGKGKAQVFKYGPSSGRNTCHTPDEYFGVANTSKSPAHKNPTKPSNPGPSTNNWRTSTNSSSAHPPTVKAPPKKVQPDEDGWVQKKSGRSGVRVAQQTRK